jgi:myb proto-oncogene protein
VLRIDWVAVAVLVPGRTKQQCRNRWHAVLVSNIDPATARAGQWTTDEDKTLKDTVRAHGGKNWKAIAALVPGQTKNQCHSRWQNKLVSNINPTTARAGKWTAEEDQKLKDGLREHGGKNWKAFAALVSGRTQKQCRNRWHDVLVSNIDPTTTALAGKWTEDEERKLRDAVGAHGAKNWKKIAALVPGRTNIQCRSRWHNRLLSKIDPTTARAGKWTADEDTSLRDAVRAHGVRNWKLIAALVPRRTNRQCCDRWAKRPEELVSA